MLERESVADKLGQEGNKRWFERYGVAILNDPAFQL